MLNVRKLTATSGTNGVLEDVSVCVGRGEVLAVTGGPGAGKTSLLRAMLGLLPIDGGAIEYAADPAPGQGLTSVVGAVFSEPALHPSRTVRAHLTILATGRRDARNRIAEIATQTGITDVLDKQARDLDAPTKFLVALASALLPAPAVLLVDEPVYGPGVGLHVAGPVLAPFIAQGGALVIAGRGLGELAPVATRATILRQGHQTWSGTVRSLYDRLRGNVLVATPAQKQLALALAVDGITDVSIRRDGRLLVVGQSPERIATVADDAGVPIQAMYPEHRSLDEFYSEFAGVPPVVPWGFGPVVPIGVAPSWAGAR